MGRIVLRILFCIIICLLWSYTGAVSAEIYKCLDSDKQVVYTESPCEEQDLQGEELDLKDTLTSIIQSGYKLVNKFQDDNNLVLNPSFEEKLSAWEIMDNIFWQAEQGFQDSAGIMIQASKPPDDRYVYETKATQCVLLNDGMRFKVSAKFKHLGGAAKSLANRLYVYWYTTKDCSKGGSFGDFLEPKNISNWQTLLKENLKPSLGAKAAEIRLVQKGRYSNGGLAYWDDISLIATSFDAGDNTNIVTIEPGVNLLSNGGFFEGLDDWHLGWPTEWVSYVGNKTPGSARVTASSTGSSLGRHAMQQCAAISSNADYILQASFKNDKTSTQNGGGRLRIIWKEHANCRGRSQYGKHIEPDISISDWQTLTIDQLLPPPEAKAAKVEIIQSVKGQGRFSAYWDDVSLKAVQINDEPP